MARTETYTPKHLRAAPTTEGGNRPAPLGLGLRVISGIFLVNMCLTLAILVLSSRHLVDYNSVNLIDWLNLVFEAIALWMLWRRLRVGRAFVMCYTAFNVVVGTLAEVAAGTFDPFVQVFSVAFDVFLFLYFAFSPAVRRACTQPFSTELVPDGPDHLRASRLSWPFIRNTVIYFCVFSYLGHWMEMLFVTAIRLGLVAGEYDPSNTILWRDWFYPYLMEGTAVVLIALVLYPLYRWLLEHLPSLFAYAISFVVNGVLCTGIELIGGLAINSHYEFWNYSALPFNFLGQICLQNGIGFAFVSSLIAWVAYPLLERLIAKVPSNVMSVAFVAVFTAFMVTLTLYHIEPPYDYRARIERELTEENLDPERRRELEEDLAYLKELEAFRAETAERLARERGGQS